MYEAHTKREQVERVNRERNAYISGLLANTNLDDNKGSKRNALQSIDYSYHEALKSIYNVIKEKELDFKEDPFFAAIRVPGRDIPVVDENDIPIEVTARPEKIEDYDIDQS